MAQNVVTNNGWDLIFAASQEGLNEQLAKLPNVPVKRAVKIDLVPGFAVTVDLDITLGPPQLRVKDGSGRQVDVLLGISGKISANGVTLPLSPDETVVVTTQLMQIEAELSPNRPAQPDKTTYHLIIDFASPDAIVDITARMAPGVLALLVNVFKEILKQDIGNNKKYQVATFTLSKADVPDALVPRFADFSFVQDAGNPGRSNLLVLMQTVSSSKGSILFATPLLAPDQDFAILVSNLVLMEHFVLPPLVDGIVRRAKNADAVPKQISLQPIPGQQFLYQISNNTNIGLNEDHDPWISRVTADIDPSLQALQLYLDAQDDVTIFDFHVDAWDRSWWQLGVEPGTEKITFKNIKEEKNSSTSLDWWKWLIAIVLGPIAVITTGILNAIVEGNVPGVGGSFDAVTKNVLQWPNQKVMKLKSIATPSHVVLTVDVSF